MQLELVNEEHQNQCFTLGFGQITFKGIPDNWSYFDRQLMPLCVSISLTSPQAVPLLKVLQSPKADISGPLTFPLILPSATIQSQQQLMTVNLQHCRMPAI
jgi:hypothetical protein